jgi:hypothetical protein
MPTAGHYRKRRAVPLVPPKRRFLRSLRTHVEQRCAARARLSTQPRSKIGVVRPVVTWAVWSIALAACSSEPTPGEWRGSMTGTMSGRAFTADLALGLDEGRRVTGLWTAHGNFSGEWWEGILLGTLDDEGEFACRELAKKALCIGSKGIYVVGILEGGLTGGSGDGAWSFSATDTEYNGEGTWSVDRFAGD